MAGHSRSENGVASPAYVPAIHVFAGGQRRGCPAQGRHYELDGIDEKTQAALSQIGREEKAAAADEVSPIVRHRANIAS